jgi:hypothetical protein
METLYGDLMLMSLATHRYLRLEPDGRVSSDSRGAEPDPNDGTALRWRRAATAADPDTLARTGRQCPPSGEALESRSTGCSDPTRRS